MAAKAKHSAPRSPAKRRMAAGAKGSPDSPARLEPATPERETNARKVPVAAICAAILFLVFLAGTVLRLHHLNDVADRTADEVLYTKDAREIIDAGLGTAVSLPRKRGYLVLLVGAMKVTGMTDEQAGAWLSCAASVASLALMGLIAIRFLSPWAGIYAMLTMALSLLDLTIARRCWQDSIMELLGLLLVWSVVGIALPRPRWWHWAVLVSAGLAAPLVKQLGAFVSLAVGLYVAALFVRRRDWRMLRLIGAGAFIAGLAAIGLTALTLGGVGHLGNLWTQMYVDPASNPSAFSWAAQNQAGPWSDLFSGFWILMPVNLILVLGAFLMVAVSSKTLARRGIAFRPGELTILRVGSIISVVMVLVVLVMPMGQNFRYLATAYSSLYLIAGIALGVLAGWAARLRRGVNYAALAVLAAVGLAGAITSYNDFELLIVQGRVPDLSINQVMNLPMLRTFLTTGRLPTPAVPPIPPLPPQ